MPRPVPGGVGGSKSNVSGSYGGKSFIESRDSASDSESGWDGDSCLGDSKTGEVGSSAQDARIPGKLTLLGVLNSDTDGVSVAESKLQAVGLLTGCASLFSLNPTECETGPLEVLCLLSVNKLLLFCAIHLSRLCLSLFRVEGDFLFFFKPWLALVTHTPRVSQSTCSSCDFCSPFCSLYWTTQLVVFTGLFSCWMAGLLAGILILVHTISRYIFPLVCFKFQTGSKVNSSSRAFKTADNCFPSPRKTGFIIHTFSW